MAHTSAFARPPESPVQLVATLTEPPAADGADLAALPAQWLEVRADLLTEPEVSWLRQHFPGRLLYTLRSTTEGGGFQGGAERRIQRLQAAAEAGYDLIDLEADRDLVAPVLDAIPAQRRLLSWHGGPHDVAGLLHKLERMSETPAALYKLIPEARQPGQELAPLLFLHRARRPDVVAFASGPQGTWTRLLAPRLGAPWIYGAASEVPGAPGQPTVDRLVRDFGLPTLRPFERLFGVVGNPVAHSLSPRIHNTAYAALDLPALYLPFHTRSFGDFWLEVVEGETLAELGIQMAGLSVTAPFKEVALAVAGASSPMAEHIGAANTLLLSNGVWEAESTDPAGVLEPLRLRSFAIQGRPAAVVGCGGAGRAAAVGLVQKGARVTLVNRSLERGQRAAGDLHLPFVPLDAFQPGEYDLVIHATSLGRRDDEPIPFDVTALSGGAAVVDLVYRAEPTPLVAACRRRGLTAIDGREVLLHQAVGQFQMMTGRDLPLDVGRRALGLEDAIGASS